MKTALLLALVSCAASAESAYTAALLRCVDKAETVTESRVCRHNVNGAYGVDAGR